MNVFELRDRLVSDYQSYTHSFIKIRDSRISEDVEQALGAGAFWPEPLLQLNPTFLPRGTIDDLTPDALHSECARIFRIDKSDTDHTGKQLILHKQDAIVGFLYLGTIAVPAPSLPRSAPAEFVVYWTGPTPVYDHAERYGSHPIDATRLIVVVRYARRLH